jgi:ubiquinone/menaquinone biosynthesis C-methylase UbiE
MLWLFLEQRTDLFWHAWKVLEIGREPFFRERLARLKKLGCVHCDVVGAGVTAIPYADASFDSVLYLDALDGAAADRRALHDVPRVLKPGGWAVVRAPGETSPSALHHTGLAVDVVPFARQLGEEACARYGLDGSGSICMASKPRAL